MCFGTCPAYKLTISGSGEVVYEGKSFVKTIGKQVTKIPREKVMELVDEFYEIDFFSLNDIYEAPITDTSSAITSIKTPTKTKEVVSFLRQPQKLAKLNDRIDDITESARWIK
jgi:hypothetical protein